MWYPEVRTRRACCKYSDMATASWQCWGGFWWWKMAVVTWEPRPPNWWVSICFDFWHGPKSVGFTGTLNWEPSSPRMASGWKHLDGERMVTIRWDERFPAAFVWVRTLEEEIPKFEYVRFHVFCISTLLVKLQSCNMGNAWSFMKTLEGIPQGGFQLHEFFGPMFYFQRVHR